MSDIEQQMLRLRASTRRLLREELELSPHRTLSALADELIEMAILRRRNERVRQEDRARDQQS